MTLLSKRYGGLEPKQTVASTPTIDLLLSHRSVRNFKQEPLKDGLLELLIAAGQSGSTSSNMQTCTVIAVQDSAKKKRLAEIAGQKFLAETPVILCFVADQSRAADIAEKTGEDFFTLPMLDKFIAAVNDVAIFAQNVAIAAESLGMGICYIGGLRSQAPEVAALLNLPKRAAVIFGLCIGYEAEGQKTDIRPRLPQPVVLHKDSYSTENVELLIEAYDDVVRKHEAGQGRPAMSWSERHPGRFASIEYLKGRESLKQQFEDLGFPLI